MANLRIALALALTFCALHAQADSGRETAWPPGFDFASFVRAPAEQLIRLVAPPAECAPRVTTLFALVDDYDRAAALSSGEQANAAYQNIHTALFPKVKGRDACRTVLFKAYLLKSTLLVSGKAPYLGEVPGGQDHWNGQQAPAGLKYSIPVLAAGNLVTLSKVKFLTQRSRQNLGEAWLDPRLLGAYDCQDSQIYVDITRRPYDLGSTFIHELEHFFKDKLALPSYYKAQRTWTKDEWRFHLINEEMLAVVLGAFSEYALDLSAYYPFSASVITDTFRKVNDHHRQAPNDLSWVDLNGWFYKYISGTDSVSPLRDWQVGHGFDRSCPATRVNGNRHELSISAECQALAYNVVPKSVWAFQQSEFQIRRSVALGYFKGLHDNIFDLSPMSSPLDDLIDSANEPLFSFMTFEWLLLGDRYSPWAAADSANPEVAGTMEFLRKASVSTSAPSPSCRIYRKAIRDGKITGYIGKTFKGGETGSRPGETGSRPSELVLPCFQLPARP